MEGNPTGAMGLPDYLGWEWKSRGRHPDRLPAGMPGSAGQRHGDVAVSIEYGGGTRPADSAG